MKKTCFIFLLFPMLAFSQSPVVMPAGMGETVPSSACLGCLGTLWNNEINICVNDAQVADISLNPNGSCFQSSCYYSRYLYAHNFGFAIPAAATIDSILVDVKRAAGAVNAIKDSIVQLYDGTTTVGNNLELASAWSNSFATVTYGHTDPLWGATWSPSIINNSGMGLMFKIENLQNAQTSAGVDFVQMTVYYTTPTGNFSVTSSPSGVEWMYSENEISANLNLASASVCLSSLYTITGQLIQCENHGMLNVGKNNLILNTGNLEDGIYLWQLTVGNQIYTQKIIIPKR